jgi:hypothetical protein
VLTVQSGFQEPAAGPATGTMKTTRQIGDDVKSKFGLCDTDVADVKSGKKFFCTVAGNWGVKMGTASSAGGLLKTGQMTSYVTRDDGTYRKGSAFDYTTGTNTVTDNFTKLEWTKDGAGDGCAGGATKTWTDAVSWAESLDFDGKTDWRLPNITELQSLFVREAGQSGPYINKTMFPNTQSARYWSSTTFPYNTASALYASFGDGLIANGSKGDSRIVRAVRGGDWSISLTF